MKDKIDRRTVIAAGAGVGIASLAGCVEEEEGDNESVSTDTTSNAVVSRPSLPADPSELGGVDRFLVESSDYQNRLLEQILHEVQD